MTKAWGQAHFEAGKVMGSLVGTLSDRRMYVGQLLVMYTPVDELNADRVRAIVDRVVAMPEADVDAFLAMHALDRTVNP